MNPKLEQPGGLRILRVTQVQEKLGVDDNAFYRMREKKHFPEGFQIWPGGRVMGWLEGVVDEWIMERAWKGLASMTPASDDDIVEPALEETP
jgi:predicted DNA-binding transcriptional regulator AlpA